MEGKRTFDPTPYIRIVQHTDPESGDVEERKVLDTAPRIAWFRAEHPIESGWQLVSEPVEITALYADFVAQVIDPNDHVVSTGHRRVYSGDCADYIEEAETQAKGRALEGAGYGCIDALALGPEEEDAGDETGDDLGEGDIEEESS